MNTREHSWTEWKPRWVPVVGGFFERECTVCGEEEAKAGGGVEVSAQAVCSGKKKVRVEEQPGCWLCGGPITEEEKCLRSIRADLKPRSQWRKSVFKVIGVKGTVTGEEVERHLFLPESPEPLSISAFNARRKRSRK